MKHALAITLIALGAAGCSEVAAPRAALKTPELPASGVVQAALVSAAENGAEQQVVIRLTGDQKVGAYQGRLAFDPRKLQLLEASVPQDGSRLVNAERASSGELRFAGFAVTGFEGSDAAVLRFRVLDASGLAEAQVTLDVTGQVDASPVPAANLKGLRGLFRDVRPEVK